MRSTVLACFLAAALLGCQQASLDPAPETPVTDAANARLPLPDHEGAHAGDATGPLGIGPDAVWNGPVDACRQDATAIDTCLLDAMRASDATPAAIAASERLRGRGEAGYVSAWDERDGVGIATIEYPFRAHTNHGTWLVDRDGRPTDVDSLADSALSVPSIEAFLSAHPDAHPFAPAEFAERRALPDGGVRLVYATAMRSCHACAVLGRLQVAYDFDGERDFAGQQVLGLE
ncbi:hypothetical protein E4582_10900 [Luteimonas yindakuii]|uniref:Uncharacterized protein n=1 Tax=Luteimonas yindakuii TaxID=2565782 RepID=A0A4Z1RDI0_9GAMM|nr:hypothetical protein [Luteimonas yindakuii]TKS52747.1 hypothetical protein E4582_10900 [Luteimonas yindakuii]